MSEAKAEKRPLWQREGFELPYVGVYGPLNCGKTLFLLNIRPEETCYIGLEFSATTYLEAAGVKAHHEIHEELGVSRDEVTPKDIWVWFEKFVRSLPAGEFQVLAIDTIGDLEQGLPEYIAERHNDYGYSSAEKFRSAKGLFWGACKKHLENLMHFIRSSKGIDTIAWAAHLKTVWEGGNPTSRKTNQGFDVWNKTASLVFELERRVVKGTLQEAPSGRLRKGRLSVPKQNEDGTIVRDEFGDIEWITVLPPQLPKCTPGQIRRYIASPAYSRRLKADEKVKEEVLTDDEKLLIQQEIARNQASAAEAQLEIKADSDAKADRARKRLQEQREAMKANQQQANPDSEPEVERQVKQPDPPPSADEPPFDPSDEIEKLRHDIAKSISAGEITKEDAARGIKSAGADKLANLTVEGVKKVRKYLWTAATLSDMEAERPAEK